MINLPFGVIEQISHETPGVGDVMSIPYSIPPIGEFLK
jgi:hypothetical protein